MNEKHTMSLIDTFAPPLEVTLVTEDVIHFRRMTMDEWGVLCESVKSERVEAAKKILNSDKTIKPDERVIALRRAYDEDVDLFETMGRYTRTVAGIRKLLNHALVEKDKAELLSLIEPTAVSVILDGIVYAPIEKPKKKVSVPPLELPAGTNDASETSETGSSTPHSSADSSTLTPESSPSDSSSTLATV